MNIQVSSKLLEKYLGAKLAYYSQDKRLSGTGILPAYNGGNGLEQKLHKAVESARERLEAKPA